MTQHDNESVKLQGKKAAGEKPNREAMPILELRRFLADELDGSPVDGDFGRSFTPLTDGLGIAPPVPKPAEIATKAAQEQRALDSRKNFFDTDPVAPPAKAPTKQDLPIGTVTFGHDDHDSEALPGDTKVNSDRAAVMAALGGSDASNRETFTETRHEAPTLDVEEASEAAPSAPVVKPTPVSIALDDEELTPTEQLAADRMIDRATNAAEPTWSGERIFLEEEDPRKVEAPKPMTIPELPPPPMPNAGTGRRFLAAVLDQAFILTMWGITLTITSAVLGGGIPTSFEMLAAGLRKEPVYWRFAILSFATLWLAHFAIGLGIVDRTFGMWVWGLKVRAFGKTDESSFFRRLSRIVLSFFFYAPVAPTLLLMPRYKGRNLLDWMTGTALYRTLE